MAIDPDYFPQNPFQAIAPDGLAAFSRDDKAESAGRLVRIAGSGVVRLSVGGSFVPPIKYQPLAAEQVSPGINGLNIILAFQPEGRRKPAGHLISCGPRERSTVFSPLPCGGKERRVHLWLPSVCGIHGRLFSSGWMAETFFSLSYPLVVVTISSLLV